MSMTNIEKVQAIDSILFQAVNDWSTLSDSRKDEGLRDAQLLIQQTIQLATKEYQANKDAGTYLAIINAIMLTPLLRLSMTKAKVISSSYGFNDYARGHFLGEQNLTQDILKVLSQK